MSKGFKDNRKLIAKPKHFKSSFKKLVYYIKPFYKPIIITLLLAIFSTIIYIVGPRLLGNITTQIQKDLTANRKINMDIISEIGIILCVLYLINSITIYLQSFIMSDVTQNIAKNFRSDISKKINKLPLKYFDNHSYGDILSRITNDVDTVSSNLNQTIVQCIRSVSTVIGVIVMMFSISAKLTLIALISIPVSGIVMMLFAKMSQKYFARQQKNLGDLNGHIEEIYSGKEVVTLFNANEKYISRFKNINHKLYQSAWKSNFLAGLMHPLMGFLGNISFVLVSIFGGRYALSGKLFIGDIQSLLQYSKNLNEPISQAAQIVQTLQTIVAASERVFEFLDEEEIKEDIAKVYLNPNKVEGNVEFKNVYFGYDETKMIIKDFSFKVKKGQKIAIVGPTGAGKTTIVNLLMKFYKINKGDILIDGVSINDISNSNCRDLFSMVLQDSFLFEGTVRENLVYGKNDISDERLKEVCKMANIDNFISALNKGYDSMLNDNTNLSIGQKQLFTIARAMLEDSRMLILDEATSSVDTRTEILIQQAMDKLSENRTSFVIAHRLSTIKNADLILVVNNGEIVEMGNHDNLLELNGFYANLYNSQFKK